MIKVILVPLDGSERSAEVLRTALVIADRFTAHIKAIHVRERSGEPFMFSELPASYRKDFTKHMAEAVDAVTAKVRSQFESFAVSGGIEVVEQPSRSDAVTASLEILDGDAGKLLRQEARLVDVVAMSRPVKHRVGGLGVGERLESILLHSGRPVLIVPPDWSARKVEHAVIGWNDSVEASRALAMTLPWLKQMQTVTVLASRKREQSVVNLREYLDLHGCTASVEYFEKERGGSVGEAMLRCCQQIGAEFLVVGGFHHTRTMQRFFGGVTTHLLAHTNIITVMAH